MSGTNFERALSIAVRPDSSAGRTISVDYEVRGICSAAGLDLNSVVPGAVCGVSASNSLDRFPTARFEYSRDAVGSTEIAERLNAEVGRLLDQIPSRTLGDLLVDWMTFSASGQTMIRGALLSLRDEITRHMYELLARGE